MRKQAAPTEIANPAYGSYYNQGYPAHDGQQQPYYDQGTYQYAGPPSLLSSKHPATIALGKPEAKVSGGIAIRADAPQLKGSPDKQVKEPAAVASTKQPVESESTYPSPHKPPSLLSIFFTEPGKFEGRPP